MVSIRLSRAGAKKHPFYHLVVTDSRNRRDGRYIERLGFFNPVAKGNEVNLRIDEARVEYWIGQGAQPSDRVASLLKAKRKGAGGTASRKRRQPPKTGGGKPEQVAEADESGSDVPAQASENKPDEPLQTSDSGPEDVLEATDSKQEDAAGS